MGQTLERVGLSYHMMTTCIYQVSSILLSTLHACSNLILTTSRGVKCYSYPIKQMRKQPKQYSASKRGSWNSQSKSSQLLILKDDVYPGRVWASSGLEGSRNLGEDSRRQRINVKLLWRGREEERPDWVSGGQTKAASTWEQTKGLVSEWSFCWSFVILES